MVDLRTERIAITVRIVAPRDAIDDRFPALHPLRAIPIVAPAAFVLDA